jgi:ribosomal protein L37AE/L43A
MTETLWQTDDCCPACGALLRQRIQAAGWVTEECGCGWQVTWQTAPDAGER